MRIKIQQFLFGKNHSWSCVSKELGRSFLRNGHNVEFISTDGIKEEYWPEDLREHTRPAPSGQYDLCLSYTAMHNFQNYLAGGKNKFGIWNYEFTHLPQGWPKYHNFTDKFLPSSKFFYDVCLKNGIPAEKMVVVPHGVDYIKYDNAQPTKLNTSKKIKILVNFAQPHIRKNIPGTLEAFGKAFTKDDDVCLVLKVVDKKPESSFELQFSNEFSKFKKKYPKHAECLVISNYVDKIEELYKACDIFFMLPHAEAFFLPAAEALASKMIVITSRYGGQLDFLNDNNSMLVGGKIIRAPIEAQYWTGSVVSEMFEPNTDEAAKKLKECVSDFDNVKSKLISGIDNSFRTHFNWNNATSMIESLCL